MKTITIQYNIDNQFGGCDLENNEQETESAQTLYKGACEIMSANNDNYTFTPDEFVGSHPDAPNVWSIAGNIEQDEEWIRDEFQRTLEDVMSQGDFWVFETPEEKPDTEYVCQANKPDWYGASESRLYYSATSGSSPFNEWYSFKDRAEALRFINDTFKSQSYVDRFTWYNGELYDGEDVLFNDEDEATPVDVEAVSDICDVIAAESRF